MNLFLNLGRSISGILADARRMPGNADANVFVLALEGDRITEVSASEAGPAHLTFRPANSRDDEPDIMLPPGVELVRVFPDGSLDRPIDVERWDVCVLNGGTTAQQWAMARLSLAGTKCRAVNLQREGPNWLRPAVNQAAAAERAIALLQEAADLFDGHGDAGYWVGMAAREVGDLLGQPRQPKQE
jgi:hypothetical protein